MTVYQGENEHLASSGYAHPEVEEEVANLKDTHGRDAPSVIAFVHI